VATLSPQSQPGPADPASVGPTANTTHCRLSPPSPDAFSTWENLTAKGTNERPADASGSAAEGIQEQIASRAAENSPGTAGSFDFKAPGGEVRRRLLRAVLLQLTAEQQDVAKLTGQGLRSAGGALGLGGIFLFAIAFFTVAGIDTAHKKGPDAPFIEPGALTMDAILACLVAACVGVALVAWISARFQLPAARARLVARIRSTVRLFPELGSEGITEVWLVDPVVVGELIKIVQKEGDA
jgi:hypothetical protein